MAKNLVIKTTMDNRDFDRKYTELTKKLQQTQKEQELLNNQTKRYKNELSDVSRKYDEMSERAERAYQRILELQEKSASPQGMSGSEYLELENLTAEYEKMLPKLDVLEQKQARLVEQVDKQAIKEQKVNEKIETINSNLTEMNQKANGISFDNASKGLNKTLKKVAKWGLAIFGIRTAYLGIRQAINYVSQYNEELANKIESIKYSLAMALEPVIEKIVNLVYTLVQYIGYLAKAWFNVDLFANASAKSTAKAAKATKSLAGFDTANTLSDNSNSGSNPSAMKGLDDAEVPGWLLWIKDHGKEIAIILTSIGAGIIAIKLGFDLLTATGIGLIVAGILIAIDGIVKFIKDPSWNNFLTILQGIALVVAGIALIMGGWVVALIALGVAIVAYVIQNWEQVKQILGAVGTWIYDNIIKPVGDFFAGLWEGIKKVFSSVVSFFKNVFTKAFNAVKSVFGKITDFFKGIWDKMKSIFTSMGQSIGDAFASAFKFCINGVLGMVESVINAPIKAINALTGIINAIPGVNIGKLSTFDLPRLATGGIVNNPGRGIPIGGAIAGESGREGVLPLTDSQAMAELGKEIGKWINVNVDLTTKLDSRVLSRSLEKVQQKNSFTRNGV